MLHSLKLRTKIALFPLISVLAFAALMLGIRYLGQQNAATLDSIENKEVPTLELAIRLSQSLDEINRATLDAMAMEDIEELAATLPKKAAFEKALQRLTAIGLLKTERTDRLAQAFTAFYESSQLTSRYVIMTTLGEPTDLSDEEYEQHGATMRASLEALNGELSAINTETRRLLSEGFANARSSTGRALNISTAISLVALALLVIISWLVIRSVSGNLAALTAGFQRLAEGDFSKAIDVDAADEIGTIAKRANTMRDQLKKLLLEISGTASQLDTASGQISASSNQHEHGATEQSSAVQETRRTIDTLITSGQEITKAVEIVTTNAQASQDNNRIAAERINKLAAQTQRISEILEVIKDIANKSELLALNAALEGSKAGEAGRGFSLVANQMQRLAENVMTSVRDIKELTNDIREATEGSVAAADEGTTLASDTTTSAKHIRLISQQQQSAIEQVSSAMDDVAQVAAQTAGGSRQISASTTELAQQAGRLRTLIGQFELGSDNSGES